MERGSNGHITSSAYKKYKRPENPDKYFGLMKVRIEEVSYIGDEDNDSFDLYGFKAVQYSVRVVGSQYDGCHITGVIDVGDIGGIYNYSETIRGTVEEQPLQNASGDVEPKLGNGDFALILPMCGNLNRCVIIKGFPHPQNTRVGATKEDGKRKRSEYNGIEHNIDKDGNMRLRIVGKKSPKGEITNPTGVGTEIILHKNGDFEVSGYGTSDDLIPEASASNDLKIKMTKATNKVEIYAQQNQIVINENGINIKDKTANELAMTSSGLTINVVGNVEVVSSGDAKVEAAGKCEVKGATVELNGAVSEVTSKNSHLGVIDLITGTPIVASTTVKMDV